MLTPFWATILLCLAVTGVIAIGWVLCMLVSDAIKAIAKRRTEELQYELDRAEAEVKALTERLEEREKTIAALRGTPYRSGAPS